MSEFKNNAYQELTTEQETLLEENFVWIFGLARSGTTWLAKELLSHNTHLINESKINDHLGVEVSDGKAGTAIRIEKSASRKTYFFSDKFKPVWKIYLRKLVLNRIHAQFQDLSKKIILKEPAARYVAYSTLSNCFPKSKIIVILRDGRDVLDSQMDALTFGYLPSGRFTKKGPQPSRRTILLLQLLTKFQIYATLVKWLVPYKRRATITSRAENWVKIVNRLMEAYNNHSEKLRYLLRYEDLRKNTLVELEKLYKFLEIDISEEKLKDLVEKTKFENVSGEKKGKGHQKRSASPGKWKKNFSSKEQNIINDIIGDTLREIGYD